MLPKTLTSVIIPRALLFVGLLCAVALVSRNIVEVNKARETLAQQKQQYQRQIMAYDRCAADVKKAGGYGDLLDVVIDARCPAKPIYNDPGESFAQYERSSRATALEVAGIVIVLASLPWLASRWTRARISRPPIRA